MIILPACAQQVMQVDIDAADPCKELAGLLINSALVFVLATAAVRDNEILNNTKHAAMKVNRIAGRLGNVNDMPRCRALYCKIANMY